MKERHLEFNSKSLCNFDIKVMPQIVISWGNKSLVREGNSVGIPFAPLMLVVRRFYNLKYIQYTFKKIKNSSYPAKCDGCMHIRDMGLFNA